MSWEPSSHDILRATRFANSAVEQIAEAKRRLKDDDHRNFECRIDLAIQALQNAKAASLGYLHQREKSEGFILPRK